MLKQSSEDIQLSVIIPMYNCESAIIRCLDSIDASHIEIIVVDDGSTDHGAQQVLDYIETHSYVRLIQKQNGGASSARNKGIECAVGTYIMFVDADDYLVPDGIERVLNLAIDNDADVVKYGICSVSNTEIQDKKSIADKSLDVQYFRGKAEALYHYDISDYHVVDALFKKLLINNNNIRFKTDLSLREDDVFMGEIYSVSNLVVNVDLPLYRYVRASKYSSTHGQNKEKTRQLINSGILAVKYRKQAILEHCPSIEFPLENLKYMRYVLGSQIMMIKAGYSYDEYMEALYQFRKLGCWPLNYKWIKVARLSYSCKILVKTFLCNHPILAFLVRSCR